MEPNESEPVREDPAVALEVCDETIVNLPPDQTWQLVADHEAQQRWIGSGAHLRPVVDARLKLAHEAGEWRGGAVSSVSQPKAKELKDGKTERSGLVWGLQARLSPAAWWADCSISTELALTITQEREGTSRVTVRETGFGTAGGRGSPHQDAVEFWRSALERLKGLGNRIKDRRESPRQAVIVIHGIGEQEPGATLKSFVRDGVIAAEEVKAKKPKAADGEEVPEGIEAEKLQHWVKPDRSSTLFELRRIRLKASEKQLRPSTYFYELYWAHLIQDTTVSQVVSWVRHLLLRSGVPKRFKPVVFAVRAVAVGTLVSAGVAWWGGWWSEWAKVFAGGGTVAVAVAVVWRFFAKSFVLGSLGDAARYLRPKPSNIEKRQAVRDAGVALLQTLHDRGNLDRIVIVGHSLGSVVAYDIITHYWIRAHRKHLRLPTADNSASGIIGRALSETDAVKAQVKQHKAWRAIRQNSQPWLITDLVTVGSPLSTADFLMARDGQEFLDLKADRILPTCPPVSDEFVEKKGKKKKDKEKNESQVKKRTVSFSQSYEDRLGGNDRTFRGFHHGGPFAVTRWTNLHFASRLLKGDAVGGRVSPQFGDWVHDVELSAPRGKKYFLHCDYWRPSVSGADEIEPHIQKLLDALRLDSGEELIKAMAKHSPLMYVRS